MYSLCSIKIITPMESPRKDRETEGVCVCVFVCKGLTNKQLPVITLV